MEKREQKITREASKLEGLIIRPDKFKKDVIRKILYDSLPQDTRG